MTLLGVAALPSNAHAINTDSANNIYVSGETNGSLPGNTLTGATDFFVVKYPSTLVTPVWVKQLGAPLSKITVAHAMTIDAAGFCSIAGYTNGNLDGNTLLGITDQFITKYNSAGIKQ